MPRPRPLVRGLFLVLAVVGLAACASDPRSLPAPAPSGSSTATRYVAIGDSYAAGSLIPVTDVANGCFRSNHNYPSLVAKAIGATLVDRTCSGADTGDFTKSQYPDVPPQQTGLDSRTTLVTVGLGGNDANVFRILTSQCPALRTDDPTGAPCRDRLRAGGTDVLQERLDATTKRLTTLLDEVHRKAPNAKVLAVGYPHIVDPAHVCSELPLATGDYDYAAQVNRALADAVRKAAAASHTTYVDVWSLSKGHDICGADPWINGATNVQGKAPRYHPFAAEHAAVAKLIVSMLGRS